MKTIEIDDDVYAALEERVCGFNDTPSDVIRRLVSLAGKATDQSGNYQDPPPNGKPTNPFTPLVASAGYLMANAGGRYFQLLSFLHEILGKEKFSQIESYKSQSRIYFARSAEAIEQSGNSTNPKLIPGTSFYALSNLSNYMKRKIMSDVLRMFSYSPSVVGAVISTLPDTAPPMTKQFVYPERNRQSS